MQRKHAQQAAPLRPPPLPTREQARAQVQKIRQAGLPRAGSAKLFASLDLDGKGLGRKGVERLLREEMGFQATDVFIDKIWEAFDVDASGTIDVAEFEALSVVMKDYVLQFRKEKQQQQQQQQQPHESAMGSGRCDGGASKVLAEQRRPAGAAVQPAVGLVQPTALAELDDAGVQELEGQLQRLTSAVTARKRQLLTDSLEQRLQQHGSQLLQKLETHNGELKANIEAAHGHLQSKLAESADLIRGLEEAVRRAENENLALRQAHAETQQQHQKLSEAHAQSVTELKSSHAAAAQRLKGLEAAMAKRQGCCGSRPNVRTT